MSESILVFLGIVGLVGFVIFLYHYAKLFLYIVITFTGIGLIIGGYEMFWGCNGLIGALGLFFIAGGVVAIHKGLLRIEKGDWRYG